MARNEILEETPMAGGMSYVEDLESDEHCVCGARMASDGACENEDHDDSEQWWGDQR